MLSDEHWSKLKGMMLQENIYNKRDLRMMVEGMFYRLRVGCPWRDLPSCCVFQTKVATGSRRSLPPIPRESCHWFHGKAATSAGCLTHPIKTVRRGIT